MTRTERPLLSLLAWLALCFGVASVGALFTPGEWYAGLARPPWTPPDWLFAPVWTALYLMMAVAAWVVWLRRRQHWAQPALIAFLFQLLLNGLWSWLFFGEQAVGLALVDILLLVLVLTVTTGLFFQVSRAAGWLMVPYLLWVLYASTLNAGIWVMN